MMNANKSAGRIIDSSISASFRFTRQTGLRVGEHVKNEQTNNGENCRKIGRFTIPIFDFDFTKKEKIYIILS